MLGDILNDEAFQADLDAQAEAFAQDYPCSQRPLRHQGLQIPSWTALSPRLRSALSRDRFQCISDADANPQVYLGVGVLDAYKLLVTYPDVVSVSKAAEGIVRGRLLAAEPERAGDASVDPAASGTAPTPERSVPIPAREDKAAQRSVVFAAAASPAPRARAPAERSADPLCVRPPPDVPLHFLMATTAGDELLTAIVAQEGKVDLAGTCRHLRKSYGLGRITSNTQTKIKDRLDHLSARKDGTLSSDDQGYFSIRSSRAAPEPPAMGPALGGDRDAGGLDCVPTNGADDRAIVLPVREASPHDDTAGDLIRRPSVETSVENIWLGRTDEELPAQYGDARPSEAEPVN